MTPEHNPEHLPVMNRIIASAIVLSGDGKVLMGRKDPDAGGVYADVWHIPGGGVDPDETLEEAMRRELEQEAIGIDLTEAAIEQIDDIGHGETTKVVDGQTFWCKMEFNRFFVRLPQTADELITSIKPGDDLVELRFFDREELANVDQIPGGREFFQRLGLIDDYVDL